FVVSSRWPAGMHGPAAGAATDALPGQPTCFTAPPGSFDPLAAVTSAPQSPHFDDQASDSGFANLFTSAGASAGIGSCVLDGAGASGGRIPPTFAAFSSARSFAFSASTSGF